ncbi:MAG: IreB family regulatory phosphoprotein [Clostridiales bacterium]|nr:IreB family regulatory phosphoprotein [Clostridiales bacterium]
MDDKNTVLFKFNNNEYGKIRDILNNVYESLKNKGYDHPISQLVGYIMSGDPTYITSFNNARSLISKLERDEILEEVFKFYFENAAK